MQTNASEMSTARLEVPCSDSQSKEKCETGRSRPVKQTKSLLRKPSSIPTGQRSKIRQNTGLQSASSKVESGDNHVAQRASSKNRATTPNSTRNSSRPRAPSASAVNSAGQKRLLENQYMAKKKRYTALKKELSDKHKNAIELFENINHLREKVIALGAKDPGKPEEVGLYTSSQTDRCLDATVASGVEEQLEIKLPESIITNEFVVTMEAKLQAIPEVYLTLCQEALNKRMEILSWFTQIVQTREVESGNEVNNEDNKEANNEANNEAHLDPAIAKQVEEFQSEDNSLRERLETTKKSLDEMIVDVVKQSEILWSECQVYRNKVKEVGSSSGMQLKEKVNSLSDQLKIEQEKALQFKERKTVLEGQVQKLRAKVRDLESQVNNGESKIQQLQSTVKQLESQVKQKEASLEQRTKEMHKITKSNESVIHKLEKQKENLESRLAEMTNELANKGNVENAVQQTMQKLEETTNELSQEKQKRLQVETDLAELKERYAALEVKSQELLRLAENPTDFTKTDSTSSNSKNPQR